MPFALPLSLLITRKSGKSCHVWPIFSGGRTNGLSEGANSTIPDPEIASLLMRQRIGGLKVQRDSTFRAYLRHAPTPTRRYPSSLPWQTLPGATRERQILYGLHLLRVADLNVGPSVASQSSATSPQLE